MSEIKLSWQLVLRTADGETHVQQKDLAVSGDDATALHKQAVALAGLLVEDFLAVHLGVPSRIEPLPRKRHK